MLHLITGSHSKLKVRARNVWCSDTFGKCLVELRWLDPIVWGVQYCNTVADIGWYDQVTLVGIPFASRQGSVSLSGFIPNDTSYDPSRDVEIYGNFYSNISTALRVLNGSEVNIFNPSGEHNVRHQNLSGTLYPAYPAMWATPPEDVENPPSWITSAPWWVTPSIKGPAMHDLPAYPNGWYGSSVVYMADGSITVPKVVDTAGKGRVDLANYVDYNVVRGFGTGVEYTRAGTGIRTSKHTYEDVYADVSDPTRVSFGYTLKVWYVDNGSYAKYRVTHSFYPDVPGAPLVNPVVGQSYGVLLGVKPQSNVSTIVLEAKVGNPACVTPGVGALPTTVGASKTGSFGENVSIYSSPYDMRVDVEDSVTLQSEAWDSLSRFTSAVEKRMVDIRLSAYNATSDALGDLTDSLSTNMIENLVELKEIAELVPDLSQLAQAIRQIAGKKWLAGGKSLVDFITALKLQHQFGIDPTIDLIVEVLPRIPRLVYDLSSQLNIGQTIARGSFAYDFPTGEFDRQSSHLKASSKVVLSGDFSPLVKSVLGLKAFGMLPAPSSMWDLLPLSFVVDWFANIGGRLTDVESVSILTLLNIRCIVYSYLITSPFEEGELSYIGSADGEALLRVYHRDISRYIPRVGQGRYDFALPDSLPNWLTAGSLAWQLFS